LLGGEVGNTGLVAVAWCVAIAFAGYFWARKLYDRDPAR
jgi:ABC-2 type transport system permease protein